MVAQATFSTGLLSSYCQAEDVRALLAAYDFSRLGDAQAQAERLATLLPITRRAVETAAGRDFTWHAADTVLLDGTGTDRVSLQGAGTLPLGAVRELRVEARLVAESDYVVYPQGEIRLKPGGALGGRFPRGAQNVAVTLDWGYPQPPPEVGLAQAKLTAAELLAEAAGETVATESVSLGDYAVRYAGGGKYAGAIRRLVVEATEALRVFRRWKVRAV